jgi:hypothetical protein
MSATKDRIAASLRSIPASAGWKVFFNRNNEPSEVWERKQNLYGYAAIASSPAEPWSGWLTRSDPGNHVSVRRAPAASGGSPPQERERGSPSPADNRSADRCAPGSLRVRPRQR